MANDNSHGKSVDVFMSGFNMGDVLNAVDTPMTIDTAETTVFNSTQGRKSYVSGHSDATLTAGGLYSGTTDGLSQDLLDFLQGTTEQVWTWYPKGDAIGNFGHGMSTLETGYNITSPVQGVVETSIDGQSNTARERVESLGTLTVVSSSANGTADDNTAATTNGGVGYLQRITNSTTRLTAASIQHSNNNSTWDDIVAFTTTPTGAKNGGERVLASAQGIKRYTRYKVTVSTTGPPASTAMQVQFGFVRN